MDALKRKIAIVIQARLGSTRLPGKILRPLPVDSQFSVLHRIINALSFVESPNDIYLATTVNEEDDEIVNVFKNSGIKIYRGDENNVLSRFADISELGQYTDLIRLTGDNPIIDPEIIEKLINFHTSFNYDHTSTKGLPLGCNIYMFKSSAVLFAHRCSVDSYDKEHVDPFIVRSEKFIKGRLLFSEFDAISKLRLTLDFPTDYALLNIVFQHFKQNKYISMNDILELFLKNRWLEDINSSNFQKRMYVDYNDEQSDAIKLLSLNSMHHTISKLLNN